VNYPFNLVGLQGLMICAILVVGLANKYICTTPHCSRSIFCLYAKNRIFRL